MSDTKSLNTSLLEVMISSKNECVFIHNWSDRRLKFVFDAWWASMNIASKRHIAWNYSRHAPSWRFYLHCRMEETGSPSIICIVCHQVLRHPSEHVTSSMGRHLLASVHIPKLNELTGSEVTELTSWTVDERALAIPMRQGSGGIHIVSSQRKIKLTIQISSIFTELTDRTLQTGSKGFSNCWISPRHLESVPHVGFCFGTYSMERNIKSWATMVIQCIKKRVGVTISQHPE
jgi:hypothetical protein